MPLSQAEKSDLQSKVTAVADAVTALVVDPPVNPLQAQLDAANVTIAARDATIAAMKAKATEIVNL